MDGIRLHVNVDHIATLRQQRGTRFPDPVTAAAICELAGAHGITVHLREDRRHIQDRDVRVLRETVKTILNLEMAATPEMVGIALATVPDLVTLVPEKREEKTTEGGLALLQPETERAVGEAISRLAAAGIGVSLFIDPEPEMVQKSQDLGAVMVELHTGDYTLAPRGEKRDRELARLENASEKAGELGIGLAAGHGLDYTNVRGILHLPGLVELNIGHSIISRAALTGLSEAVAEMLALMTYV
ncbi:pyridoxine 5'-phosphate synthase [Myxococcota bacterium]|nr:pyridoxine 5'-phosphate synthase [Myxococcota bacterium]MBU1537261.1 pyridoxine 5'-phosphate synthase [Myxococcota bacterium]